MPDVTLSDLASFRPAAPVLTSEPAGSVGIAGMPTNLVASAAQQFLTGEVLGYPVTVRFTPASFTFAHGDGTTAEPRTGGASWTALRQAEFTPTATSHVYADRGEYAVSATVRYAAAVDFGSGLWRPVPGTVDLASGSTSIRIVEAHTVLVDRTCLESPTGPGC